MVSGVVLAVTALGRIALGDGKIGLDSQNFLPVWDFTHYVLNVSVHGWSHLVSRLQRKTCCSLWQ